MRKTNLERLLRGRPDGIIINPFECGAIGPDLFRAACDMGLEGLVSKRADRPYCAAGHRTGSRSRTTSTTHLTASRSPRPVTCRTSFSCAARSSAARRSWRVLGEVPDLLGPIHYRARFEEQTLSPDGSKAHYAFELKWKRPERATPPRDMLAALDGRYETKAFDSPPRTGDSRHSRAAGDGPVPDDVTRHTVLPTSSAISSPPVLSIANPTGRPRA
jgi:hypothetical protein